MEAVKESCSHCLPNASRCSPLRLVSWMSCEPPSHIEARASQWLFGHDSPTHGFGEIPMQDAELAR